MVFVDDAAIITAGDKPDHDEHAARERTAHAVREKPHTIHRRVPVILEALDPVDRSEREGQGQERDAEGGRLTIHVGPLQITIGVLAERGFTQAGREPHPNHKKRRSHAREHVQVQEAGLFRVEDVLADGVPAVHDVIQIHPGPDEVALVKHRGEPERQEEQREPLESGKAVFELAADEHRPVRIKHMMDQNQHHHADGDRSPEGETDKVGVSDVLGTRDD